MTKQNFYLSNQTFFVTTFKGEETYLILPSNLSNIFRQKIEFINKIQSQVEPNKLDLIEYDFVEISFMITNLFLSFLNEREKHIFYHLTKYMILEMNCFCEGPMKISIKEDKITIENEIIHDPCFLTSQIICFSTKKRKNTNKNFDVQINFDFCHLDKFCEFLLFSQTFSSYVKQLAEILNFRESNLLTLSIEQDAHYLFIFEKNILNIVKNYINHKLFFNFYKD